MRISVLLFAFLCTLTAVHTTGLTRAELVGDLVIRLPQQIDPDRVTILVGSYGDGLSVMKVHTKPAVYEYRQGIRDGTTAIKLLIFSSGYKLMTAEMDVGDIARSTPVIPRFEKLPTVPVTLRFADSGGNPVANQRVLLTYALPTHDYFGYLDGMAWMVEAASGTTDAAGMLKVSVPDLTADTFFVKHTRGRPGFSISFPDSPDGGRLYFVPPAVPFQHAYPQLVTVAVVYGGRISGKVNKSLLSRNGVQARPGPADRRNDGYRVWFMAQAKDRSGSGVGVAADGSFSLDLKPGQYDLSIEVRDERGLTEKVITIRKDFRLGENEKPFLDLK